MADKNATKQETTKKTQKLSSKVQNGILNIQNRKFNITIVGYDTFFIQKRLEMMDKNSGYLR